MQFSLKLQNSNQLDPVELKFVYQRYAHSFFDRITVDFNHNMFK